VARIAGTIEPPETVVQGAMGKLQSACTEAYEAVEWCLDHLSSAAYLLDTIGQAHGVLNAGVLIDWESQHAYRDLKQTMERHLDTWVQPFRSSAPCRCLELRFRNLYPFLVC
jgi:hypothetical protein